MSEKVNVEFTDNGSLNKLNAGAEKIKSSLEAAAAASKRIAAPVAAARQGVAASNKAAGGLAADDSNTARGVGGLTGAAGRDFAAQSRGLGGLVHVYATFAANIFAISAAFTALNKAANIDNMIKGLDQLGAASGRNLGSVAKGLVQVTDGALSLADAMTAVAQASAGGMSSQNILRMGEVAKKASQALGRDMADAMNRLSRGITKIEPELLDELGIMVKVDEASRNYARTLGKTASALSDFEKRQGYANAVLEEGERKFGSINLDANPYQKLQASVTNLAQATASLINDFLGPLLNILSSSPTALATALGLVATTLLRQAVPAISLWRQNMESAAKKARDLAIEANKLRVSRRDEAVEKMAEDYGKREAAAAAKTRALADKLMADVRVAKSTAELMKSVSAGDMDSQKIKQLEKQADIRGKLSLLEEGASKRRIANAAERQKEAEGIRQVTAAAKEQLAVEMASRKFTEDNPSRVRKATIGLIGNDAVQTRIADAAVAKSQQAEILSNIAKSLPDKGVIQSWKDLNTQISNARNKIKENGEAWDKNEKAMGAWNAGATRIKGGLAIITSGITNLIRSLSSLFFYVGVIVVAYQTLNAIFSTGAKELEKYSTSLEGVNSSVENVARTLESIEKAGFEKAFSISSIQARATAFGELADSVDNSLKAFNKVREAQSWWDKGWDWVSDVLPFIDSTTEKLIKTFSSSLSSNFKLLEGSPLKAKASKLIEDVFNIKNIDVSKPKALQSAISGLNLTQDQFIEKISKFQSGMRALSMEFNNTASYASSFANNITEISKIVDDMNNSLLPKDNMGKIGQQLITSSRNMAEALKEPTTAMASLIELAGDMKALSLLPPDTSKQLINAREELVLISSRLAEARDNLVKARSTEKKQIQPYVEGTIEASAIKRNNAIAEQFNKNIDSNIQNWERQVTTWENVQKSAIKEFGLEMDKVLFRKGTEHLTNSLNLALQQGSIAAAKGYLSVLKQAGGATAASEGRLEQQNLNAQLALIDANYNSAKQLELNTIALEKSRLERKAAEMRAKGITNSPELDEIAKSLRVLENREKLPNISAKDFKSLVAASTSKNSLSEEWKQALIQSSGLFAQMIGKESQQAGIRGQAAASKATTAANVVAETAALEKERLNTASNLLATQLAINSEERKLVGQYTEANQIEKESLEIKALGLSYAQVSEELAAKAKIAELAKQHFAKGSVDYQNAIVASKDIEAKQNASYLKFQQDVNSLNTKHIGEQLSGRESIRAINAEIAAKEIKDATDLAAIQLSNEENVLSFRQKMGFITAENLAAQQASIAISRQENSLLVERNALENTFAATRAKLAGAVSEAASAGIDTTVATNNLLVATQQYERQVKLLDARNESIIRGIELQKESNIELAKQAEFTENLVTMSESLALVFGKIGAGIGAALLVMDKMAKKQLQFEGQRLALEKERSKISEDPLRSDEESMAMMKKVAKEEKKLNEDIAISQLNNISAMSAATKQMFDEKTAAYKVFDGIQKASAIMSMTIQAQQMAAQIAALPSLIAGGVGKLVSQGGFAGLAAAAGFIALMASLGGGSSVSVPSAGFSAADMQQTQGTGTSWVDGEKKENGGGVFGDSEAKSESIVNSLEIIKDNTIEGLRYDNLMLKALENIDSGINKTAKTLYSVVGIRSGSITGQKETSTSTSGIQGLFGKTTTKNLIDSGIVLKGTFGELADSAEGLVSIYETIRKTTVKSGFLGIGGGTKTSEKRNLTLASPEISKEITGIFSAAEELFISLGENLGITAESISDTLDSIDIGKIFISLKGLKGDELAQEFNSVISSILDSAAGTIFDSMKQYANFGEGLLETTIRVIDANQKIKVAVSSIGMVINNFSFEVTEALTEAAGGLDKFTDRVTFFAENFLSESERLAPVMENVVTTLEDLGYTTVDTREEFADIVQALDLTTVAGRTIYTALMELAPAFAMVYPEIEKTTGSLQDLIKEGRDLQDELNRLTMSEEDYLDTLTEGMTDKELAQFRTNQLLKKEIALINERNDLLDRNKELDIAILQAQGRSTEALALSRSRELQTIDPANRALQLSTWAREDELTAINTSNTALGTMKGQFAGLQTAATQAADALASSLKNITAGYVNAKSRTAAATQAVVAAQRNILNNLNSARQNVASAAEALASAQNQAADELRGLANNIREFIESISTSALSINSPKEQLKILQNQFSKEASLAKSGDKDALSGITGTSQKLLELAKEQSSNRLDYARIVGTVTSTLDDIAKTTEDKVGPALPEQDAIAKAQADLAAATQEMARWQQAAAESGALSLSTEEDLLTEFRKAKDEEELARADEAKWRNAVEISGAATETATTDYLEEWRIASANDAIASANLASAMELSNGINLKQNTLFEDFLDTLGTYLDAQKVLTEGSSLTDVDDSVGDVSTSIKDSTQDTTTILKTINTSLSDTQEAIIGSIDSKFVVLNTNIDTTRTSLNTAINATKTSVTSSATTINTKLNALLERPAANDSMKNKSMHELYPDHSPGGFASGGYHEGGARIVGERGPELEVTGPARIFSTQQTREMFNNAELVKEIQALRQEVATLRFASQQTELHTRKSKDLLVRVTKDGEALYTLQAA